MRRIRRRALVLLPLIARSAVAPAAGNAAFSITEARFARLSRGINLPGWFAWGPVSTEAILALFPASQLEQLHRIGFNHVRLPIDLWLFLNGDDPARPKAEPMTALHEAIDRIMATGLAVIVDVHPTDETTPERAWGKLLEQDDRFADDYVAFWGGLARELARHDPERLFLELMNEPAFHGNTDRWTARLQPRLAARVRVEASSHTLIATAPRYSWPAELAKLTPLADPNVIYTFHYYDPFIFTHQGFKYGPFADLQGLPYPADLQIVADLLPGVPAASRLKVLDYGRAGWNAARIAADIAVAADWSREHGVRVICDEFGVVRDTVPIADRARWLRDLRQALEAQGIGWSLWEFGGWFGLFGGNGAAAERTSAAIAALGLRLVD